MASPVAHAFGAMGAYLAATSMVGTGKLRGVGAACSCVAVALLPDLVALLPQEGWEVTGILRGIAAGVLVAAALAGAVPGFRAAFWASFVVLLAAHGSQALLDAAGPSGVAWLAPMNSGAMRLGPVLLPGASVHVLGQPFLRALKVMSVEIGILLPLVWTAWVLGRESGAARTKGWLAAYAASWPLGVGLMIWCMRTGGRL